MTYTGTHEPLFIAPVDPHSFFEKEGSLARMPDDEKKWPAHLLSEIHKALPFVSDYDVDLSLDRLDPEAGAALGYAMLRNKSVKNVPMEDISKPSNRVRVPIIIQDRMLQPFHTFELGGGVYPLTPERLEAAMLNPSVFDSDVKRVPASASLVDNLYPPYQQRQGFGRVSEPSATGLGGVGGAGSKLGSAPSELNPVSYESATHPHGYSKSDLAGSAIDPHVGMLKKKALKLHGKSIEDFSPSERKAFLTKHHPYEKKGSLLDELGEAGRRSMFPDEGAFGLTSGPMEKDANKMLLFKQGVGLPGMMVFQKMEPKPRFRAGVVGNDFWFYPLHGTAFWMGVHKSYSKALEAESDQKKIRQKLVGPMRDEMMAARANMPSPGKFILVVKVGDAFKYIQPEFTPMLAAAGGGNEMAVDQSLRKSAAWSYDDHSGSCALSHPGLEHQDWANLRMDKQAYVFGADRPGVEYLASGGIPYKEKHQEYGRYINRKAGEEPTGVGKSTGVGALIGGGTGLIAGGLSGGLPGAAIGTLGGAAVGGLAGLAAGAKDKAKVHQARRLKKDPKAAKEYTQGQIAKAPGRSYHNREAAQDRRHREMMGALNKRASAHDPEVTEKFASWLLKVAQDMPDFEDQNRPEKVKDIYRALKRDHPGMSAEKKARIAARQGKPGKQKQGPPYSAPIKQAGMSLREKLQSMKEE